MNTGAFNMVHIILDHKIVPFTSEALRKLEDQPKCLLDLTSQLRIDTSLSPFDLPQLYSSVNYPNHPEI